MFRVTELQSKLDDVTAERRSVADSTSSPIDDELHNISDTGFSSDRPPAFRPPLPPPRPPPPPFFRYPHSPRFIPPFYGRRPPPPDRLHSPPAFDAYRGEPYARESPRPRDISPPSARRPLPPEHHRSLPPFDSYHEEAYMGRSPPPRGNSPPYYNDRPDGRRSPPTVDCSRGSEPHGRRSPRAGENSTQRRDRYYRQDRPRTPDEESFNVPSGTLYGRPPPVVGKERYQQSVGSHHSSHRNVVDAVRSPPRTSQSPADDDGYPTY